MKKYKLELSVEAETAEEAANKLFDELYNGPDNMYIEARDMIEVKEN